MGLDFCHLSLKDRSFSCCSSALILHCTEVWGHPTPREPPALPSQTHSAVRQTSLSPDGNDPEGSGQGWGKCTELGEVRGSTSPKLEVRGRLSG